MDISKQQVIELVGKVLETCPGIEDTGVKADELISSVVAEATGLIGSLEAVIKESGGFGASAALLVMVQGAVAAVLDTLPPDNVRAQAYRGGRVIGRFIADRFAEKIRAQLGGN